MKQLIVRLLQKNTGYKQHFCTTFFWMNITKNTHNFLIFQRLNFAEILKVYKVIKIWKCELCRATPVIDISSNVDEHGLETAFLQHFFSINITKNSHPFLVIQRLNLFKRLKLKKVIEIWKCDLCRATPCITKSYSQETSQSSFSNLLALSVSRYWIY